MNFGLLISFFIPFIYVCFSILREKHPVSFRGFFYIFALFFYSIAAFVQFFEPIGEYTVSKQTFFEINLILFLCYILYDIVYFNIFSTNEKTATPDSPYSSQELSTNSIYFLFILLTVLGIFTAWKNNFNLHNLLFRGGDAELERVTFENQSIALILGNLRIMFSLVAFSFILYSKSKKTKLVGLFFLLFFCAPTATARYFTAAAYIPILFAIYPKFIYSRFLFKFLMLGGVLFVFPLLEIFRHSEMSEYRPWQMFCSLHFDSYISLAYVYEKEFVTYGYQLLGCIFFWIPRSFWPSKPVGSGHTIAEMDNLFDGFTNISMNFLGEGYINFGFFGIFLFIVIFALFSKKMDQIFWEKYRGDLLNSFSMFYLYILGMIFFVLRGDLLSGTAYTVGICVMIYIISKVITWGLKNTNE